MDFNFSPLAILIFIGFVSAVLALSFLLGRRAKSSQGYYAAHGQVHWFVNGVAFAGDYVSAASFLGICGMVAFFGYDGFLYAIGFLAGWVVALFVVAEPLKELGRFTFADALDSRFQSRAIKLTAAISTLVVSIFYLIPQMVGAGVLVQPLLGLDHWVGVVLVGMIVMAIVVMAGMVSTTWVQFIKGAMLILFCAILVGMILQRGFVTEPAVNGEKVYLPKTLSLDALEKEGRWQLLPQQETWKRHQLFPLFDKETQTVALWRKEGERFLETQQKGSTPLFPVGHVMTLPDNQVATGPLNPLSFLRVLQSSQVMTWRSAETLNEHNELTTVYFPTIVKGSKLLVPGNSPLFKSLQGEHFDWKKLDFLSLMLALFLGTAALPHILIRYYTVKDASAVRKSSLVGIVSIGVFYVLTLYIGLGAMTSGTLDVANSNMATPLLAKSFGELTFAIISAIAFTTILGTVSGLILAASGAVAHDLLSNVLGKNLDDEAKVRAGKWAAVGVGLIAMALGIVFEKVNVTFLVGWAFNIAASTNLPALVMLLFWKKTTKEGIACSILVGLFSSLGWILLSGEAFEKVYGLPATMAWTPFTQPAVITVPLSFLTLIAVSLSTQKKRALLPAFALVNGEGREDGQISD